jgi:hypothetical protein
VLILAAAATPAAPPETINHEINARVRAEGDKNSQIMRTLHFLTDVYGPRLTGSPNHKAAAEWAVKQMTEWGFVNGRLEPWEFGHPGWLNERFAGYIVSPVRDSLVGEVLGWTPSTKGTVSGTAVQIVPPERPTEEALAAWLEESKVKVRQRIVLVGRHTAVPVTLTKAPLRRDDEQVRKQYDPNAPAGAFGGRGGGRGNATPAGTVPAAVVNERIDAMLVASGALVRLNAGATTGRSAPSRTAPTTPARWSPPSSCATRITAGSRGSWPAGHPYRSSSRS